DLSLDPADPAGQGLERGPDRPHVVVQFLAELFDSAAQGGLEFGHLLGGDGEQFLGERVLALTQLVDGAVEAGDLALQVGDVGAVGVGHGWSSPGSAPPSLIQKPPAVSTAGTPASSQNAESTRPAARTTRIAV